MYQYGYMYIYIFAWNQKLCEDIYALMILSQLYMLDSVF